MSKNANNHELLASFKYSLLGLRYSIDGFRRMLYANIRLDNGRKTDGTKYGNAYTIGIRWDFPKQ